MVKMDQPWENTIKQLIVVIYLGVMLVIYWPLHALFNRGKSVGGVLSGYRKDKFIMLSPRTLEASGLLLLIIFVAILPFLNLTGKGLKSHQIFLISIFLSMIFSEGSNGSLKFIFSELPKKLGGAEMWARQWGDKAGKASSWYIKPKQSGLTTVPMEDATTATDQSETLGCGIDVDQEYTSIYATDPPSKDWKRGLPSGHSQIWGFFATFVSLYTLGNYRGGSLLTLDFIITITTIIIVWILAFLVMRQRKAINCHKWVQICSGLIFGIYYAVLIYISTHEIFRVQGVNEQDNIQIPEIIRPIYNIMHGLGYGWYIGIFVGVTIILIVLISLAGWLCPTRLSPNLQGGISEDVTTRAAVVLSFLFIIIPASVLLVLYYVPNILNGLRDYL